MLIVSFQAPDFFSARDDDDFIRRAELCMQQRDQNFQRLLL